MELVAAIEALKYFDKYKKISLYTDSKYVKDGIEKWIIKWKNNGWKTSAKKNVKNKDLWIKLDLQIDRHDITWRWVKGHAGDLNNEKADLLARKFIDSHR